MPESYKHLFAKKLVVEWLRGRAFPVRLQKEGDARMIDLSPVKALVSAHDPYLGVYEEYPVVVTPETTSLHTPWRWSELPSYQQLRDSGEKVSFVLDIAVLHQGQIKYGLEIVHSNPPSAHKLTSLQMLTRQLPFELHTIDAEWVLTRCVPPLCLQTKRLVPGYIPRLPFPTQKRGG